MKPFKYGWLCLLIVIGRLQAAPPDTLVLSLETSVERALSQNLQIKQDALTIKSQQAAVDQAKANLLPSVGAISRYNYNVGRSINPVTNDFTDQPVRSQDYGLSSDLTVYDGWRNIRTIRNQKDALQAARFDLSATQRQTILSVMQAYLAVLSRRELWEDARYRVRETEQELQRTQLLVSSGEVSPTNLTQLRAQRAEDQLTAIRRKNDWQLAQLQLRQWLFIPAHQPIRVMTPEVPQETLPETKSLVTLYEQAQQIDPALKGAAIRQAIADRDVKIAQGGYLPTLKLNLGGYSSYSDNPPPFLERYTYADQLDFNLRKFVSFELSVPIYNRGQLRSQVQQAKIDRQRTDLSLVQQQQQLWETLETAYWNVQTLSQEYQAAQERAATAEEAFKSATTQFELGVIDVISFSQAKRQLNEAVAASIQTKYQFVFHRKMLDFYQSATIK